LRLAERAAQPPERVRRALHIEGVASPIGSIEVALAERMRTSGLLLPWREDGSAVLVGPSDAALERAAVWLHAQGVVGKWRNELLAVTDESGTRHAVIERAAVRPLGIATYAVHLIGFAPNGSVWVQQRAFDKATDPGQWDTLVGGLVAADESHASALERESWEEAGLRLPALRSLVRVDQITVRRPVTDGYMVEHIDAFEAVLPESTQPANQDGEVERFECLTPAGLIDRLAAGKFTLEAALLLAASLRRRGFV
jgi:8-oxo-dGTP pyrophosphatase MutT (NUDIX family)